MYQYIFFPILMSLCLQSNVFKLEATVIQSLILNHTFNLSYLKFRLNSEGSV